MKTSYLIWISILSSIGAETKIETSIKGLYRIVFSLISAFIQWFSSAWSNSFLLEINVISCCEIDLLIKLFVLSAGEVALNLKQYEILQWKSHLQNFKCLKFALKVKAAIRAIVSPSCMLSSLKSPLHCFFWFSCKCFYFFWMHHKTDLQSG